MEQKLWKKFEPVPIPPTRGWITRVHDDSVEIYVSGNLEPVVQLLEERKAIPVFLYGLTHILVKKSELGFEDPVKGQHIRLEVD